MTTPVERARAAFAGRHWVAAYESFTSTEHLDGDDLERLAVTAHLLGEDDASAGAWERAYGLRLADGDVVGAARCATWLGTGLLVRGEAARASGWFARAARVLEEAGVDCAVTGYLCIPSFLQALTSGDIAAASRLADEMEHLGRRFAEPDLLAMGVLGQGQVAMASGEVTRAMHLFDEVMVAVTADEVSPIPAGIVYCSVIDGCMAAFDLRRAAEWTEALRRWCADQPGLVPYRGQCLVHRSQVLLAHGAWSEAEAEADRAREHLSRPVHPALGLAIYQRGELHRLRGDLDDAERAYRAAHEHGQDPAPGLALLRLAEGKVDAAVATVRRMVDEYRDPLGRAPMLAASVEILLAAGDVAAAEAASGELSAIATQIDAPLLRAMAWFAAGSVLFAKGEPVAALEALRRAQRVWRELQMPYEAARAQVLIGRACELLDDRDTAELELRAARATFESLGARPDAERTAITAGSRPAPRQGPLTERECEVLRLVAAGKTDRDIAADLFISEHTVGRHLQNIFRKLELSSRAAATAYAYEHHLV